MSIHPRPPIEPLSDEEWRSIESAVFEELDEQVYAAEARRGHPVHRRALLWVGVTAVAAAVLLLFVWRSPTPPGHASTPEATPFAAGADGSLLALGEVRLTLGAHSRGVAMGDDARGRVVALEHGQVTFEVPPRRERPSFLVQAGDVRVEVVGTHFSVRRDGDDVEVIVIEGHVRVTDGDRATDLRRGERWHRPRRPRATAVTEEQGQDRRAAELGTVDLEEAEAPPTEPAATEAPRAEAQATRTEHGANDLEADHAQRTFEEATGLETRDPGRAIELYRRVAARPGPWAAAALYAWGRLELEGGHTEVGERVLRRYLRAHPEGVNAPDARGLLGE